MLKIGPIMVEKLALAGVEARPNGEFCMSAVYTIETIGSVMIHYTDEPVDFRLEDYLVTVIKLWLEKEFGRECRKCGDTDRPRHVDHVVPIPHDYRTANLQLLYDLCHKEVRHSSPTRSLSVMPFVHVPNTLPKQKTSGERAAVLSAAQDIMRDADAVAALVHGLPGGPPAA